jgi:hypothetical protein
MITDFRVSLSTLDLGGISTIAKKTPVYWCGGATGAPTDWNNPLNWYNRTIPGWYDDVVIPATHFRKNDFPIIDNFVSDIATLKIEEGGKLMIARNGKITIDGLSKRLFNLINFGDLVCFGELTTLRSRKHCIVNSGNLINRGSLAVDKRACDAIKEESESTFNNHGELLYLC